jgi:hypothetical protein
MDFGVRPISLPEFQISQLYGLRQVTLTLWSAISSIFIYLFIILFFSHTVVWIQDLTLASQALSHLSHSASPSILKCT